jgi:hypothetical protein
VAAAREAFTSAIFADLNTAGALGVVFDLVRVLNAAIDAGGLGRGDLPAIG